jgi:hypothetical protein
MTMSLAPASKGAVAAMVGIPPNHSKTRYGCIDFLIILGSCMNFTLLIASNIHIFALIEGQ